MRRVWNVQTLWNVGKYLLAIGLFGYVLSLTSWHALWGVFSQASGKLLAVVVLFFAGEILLTAWRFHFLLKGQVGYWRLVRINVLQKSLSALVSTGAGFLSYVTDLKVDEGVKTSFGALSFLLAKVCDVLAVGIFVLFSMAAIGQEVRLLWGVVLMLEMAIWGMLLVLVGGMFYGRKWATWGRLWTNKWPVGAQKIEKVWQVLESLTPTKALLRYFSVSVMFSLALFFVNAMGGVFMNRAFHIPIGFWAIVFMIGLQRLMSYVPIYVFGGIGVAEVTALYLYNLFGFPKEMLAPVLVGMRLVTYGMYMLSLGVMLLVDAGVRLVNKVQSA